ncbi:MAG TPA: Ig-like domain-containing protein, partial [Longimicrobium sp.]|nr:Ig-like domain-containing protein [Longimicrobium sp.]
MKKPFFSIRRAVFGVVLASIAIACGDATGPKTEPVASLDISGIPATLYVGAAATLSATPRDADGEALANRPVTWMSSDTTIAGVSAQGVVTGRKAGEVVIVATSEQKSATATVRVTLEPPATMEITGGPAEAVVAGTVVQLAAAARNGAGTVIPGRVITWTSANPQLATVSDSGKVQTLGAGEVVITAANEGVSTTFTLRIVERVVSVEIVGGPATPVVVGASVQLNAVARSAAGAALSGRSVTWRSGNADMATVSSGGTVQALAPGQVEITATVEGVSATLVLHVLEPVETVQITGAPAGPMIAGMGVQLTAVARNRDGAALPGRVITWSSGNTELASVTPTGFVETHAPGEVTILATHQGVSASVTLRILERVGSVQITGAPADPVLRGAEVQLAAVVRNAAGATLPGRTVTWTSSPAAVASVSADGLVRALAPGFANITAAVDGVTHAVTVFVLEPVAAVEISGAPTGPVVAGGPPVQLYVAARGAAGEVLTGRVITWTSSNPDVAPISPAGSLQALSAGEAVITATVEGISASFTLTVLHPVASVAIVGAPAGPVLAGTTTQLRAVARNAAGDSLGGRAVFWMTSDYGRATVSAEGLVTAVAPGNVLISATVEGRNASFTLDILEPVSTVTVTSPLTGVYQGQTVQLSAALRDRWGAPLTGRAIAWTTSDALRATVDSAGRVTATGAGLVTLTATSEGKTGMVTLQVNARPTADWSQATSWTTHQGNARHTGYVPVTADPVAFDSLWARSPLGATTLNPVTEGDGRLFISGYAYFGGQTLAGVDARTGAAGWSHSFGTIHGVHPPAYGNGTVYATTSGHGDAKLYAFNAASGAVTFAKPYGNQWSRYFAPVVVGETVHMAGGSYGGMYAFNATTGTQRWFADTNQYDEWTPAVDNGRVYAYTGSYAPKLQVHDAATGAALFSIADPGFQWNGWSMNISPVLGSMNNVLVTQAGRLVSFNLQTRTIGWQRA